MVVPENVADALIGMATEEDFDTVIGFFEAAGTAGLSRYPLPGGRREKIVVPAHRGESVPPEYGQAAAAVEFEEKVFIR